MKIYHWFIPSCKNKFHPTAIQPVGLVLFLAVFISIPLVYNLTTSQQFKVLGYATNINTGDLMNISNQERVNSGLAPLSLNSALSNAAQAKANDMLADNYWSHIAPDGTNPWSFILASGYQYTSAGENLAKDFSMSSGVVAGWMASPTHRANVLNSSYKDVGYAVVNGTLLGSQTTLVVAMYGAKSDPPAVVATTSPPPATSQPIKSDNQPAVTKISSSQPAEVSVSPAIEKEKTTTQETVNVQGNAVTPANSNTGYTAGEVEGATSLTYPAKVYNSLNWGQKTSLLLISAMILLFSMKHTLIWREKKRGLKHIWLRAHPLGQIAILTFVFIITLVSGAGAIL